MLFTSGENKSFRDTCRTAPLSTDTVHALSHLLRGTMFPVQSHDVRTTHPFWFQQSHAVVLYPEKWSHKKGLNHVKVLQLYKEHKHTWDRESCFMFQQSVSVCFSFILLYFVTVWNAKQTKFIFVFQRQFLKRLIRSFHFHNPIVIKVSWKDTKKYPVLSVISPIFC